jgi:Aspartyl protease
MPQALFSALTIKTTGISKALISTVTLRSSLGNDKIFPTQALWDTGATCSGITENVVETLGLLPTGFARLNTVSQQGIVCPFFTIDVILQNGIYIPELTVSLGLISEGIDMLIGMDIITLGDFSVTNFNGNTCMSFRIPSMHQVDYVEE